MFDKAPPAIDEALRARVSAFYQAHVDGKFRLADQYVAEDSKDVFFAAEKPHYGGFQVTKITYTDNFTKATVITACKTEMFFHGHKMPVTMPAVSHWKMDNGEWFWYYVKAAEMDSPWGMMKPGPPGEGSSVVARIPTDPMAAARNILARVVLDRNAVTVDQTKASTQEIHLKNGMLGAIKVLADPTGTPGLTVRPAHAEVAPGEDVAVAIAFNPDDPEVNCRECLMHPGVRPAITVNLTVQPTQQRFPIQITFTQPERAK
ncbi:MAG TPA: hypothetical protein VGS58_09985 [Candidatus Sulfopaludibacter sp.]|nr:hypothetical protein [Candidatus Sulfopaludibacter sp.]